MKEFNIKRHYSTKHRILHSLTGQIRKDKIQNIIANLEKPQQMFHKQRTHLDNVVKASFIVSSKLQSLKPFAEGEFIKESLDESIDLSDTAQLAIFIRGVDKEFTVIEELLVLHPLKGTTTGEDIFNEVQKDQWTTSKIRKRTKVRDVLKHIRKLKWNWTGHTMRTNKEKWTKDVLEWYPRNGNRKRRGQIKRWEDDLPKGWRSRKSTLVFMSTWTYDKNRYKPAGESHQSRLSLPPMAVHTYKCTSALPVFLGRDWTLIEREK
ncbi:General transcription factor II-I repeat domain-containing protein 2 [Eumeta japonica]|uniref:General transcription factor II-I repeat domain-containing protein 2 n=1 Tax=Eumeta variegata TaxID=151549 RepID=A0A4C1Y7A8_EUMVA|nr:General transcription factor II-I repeat domain-containing protein 2 [Eumeta japonica]